MTLLITGGCGFIGSELVRQAVSQGQDVVNIDALTYAANAANLASIELHKNYRFEQIDIRDKAALSQLFKDISPEAIIHLAAESHVDRSIDGADDFISTNITGTFNLLECARAQGSKFLPRFYMSLQMKFTAIYPKAIPHLRKAQLTHPAHPIPQVKPQVITWCGLGAEHMTCPFLLPIVRIITGHINSQRNSFRW